MDALSSLTVLWRGRISIYIGAGGWAADTSASTSIFHN